MEHPAPTRARGQVRERIEYTHKTRPKRAFPTVVAALRLDRPVNQKRPAHNGSVVYEAPEATVPALIAVVAHREIFSRRHDDFVASNEFPHFLSPLRLKTRGNHLSWQRGKVIVQRIVVSGRIVHYVRLIEQFAIHINGLVHHFHAVTRQADHALHKVLMFLIGKFKNDNVSTLEGTIGQEFFVPRTGTAKNKFVDQQMVANLQSAFHGSRRNLEGLHDKSRAKQGQNHGNEERLQVLGKSRLFMGPLRLGYRRYFLDWCQCFLGHSLLAFRSRSFELFQGASCRLLLCFFLCTANPSRQALPVDPDFDLESLLMIGPAFSCQTILGRRLPTPLKELLEG